MGLGFCGIMCLGECKNGFSCNQVEICISYGRGYNRLYGMLFVQIIV